MKYKVNMKSAAASVKGQGVGSAYEEQVALAQSLPGCEVSFNRHMRADITHYHTINFSYFLSIPFAKACGTTVGYVHFLPETMEQSLRLPKLVKKVFYKYLLTFYRSMDALVTVNPYFIGRLAANGVDPSKVVYIPNFVDDREFHALSPEKKRALREEFQLDLDRFTVLCAGQLQTRKGAFDFFELARRRPEMQFVWAGGFSFGKITDGYEEIKKVVENPPKNLHFTGIVDRDRMNDIYNLADVMFLPSYEELFPMTILEAMNCKLPLLLRDIPIYEDILFDYYLRESDNDGFERVLKRLRDDPEYYAQAQANSWRGHNFYNREHVRAMWDGFYTDCLAARSAKRVGRVSSKSRETRQKEA